MKNDPNQLMLEFTSARQQLADAITNYVDKAVAAATAPENRREVVQLARADVKATEHLRKSVKRGIGVLHDQTGRSWHELFVLAYHEFSKRTGIHPVAETIRCGGKTHLDVVEERNMLPQLLEVIGDMINKPETLATGLV